MQLIGLLDCNSFFASCEQVFAPHLLAKPVVVLSNNDGCVVARSAEAKKLGISMGTPFFQIKKMCQQGEIHAFSSNFRLYADMSRRVMTCLRQWTPKLEIYSIDEAFMDFSGMLNAETDAFQRKIVETVKKWTGIPVSLGVARTKTLAKIANHVAKKNGVGFFTLNSLGQAQEILSVLPVGEVWGVGTRSARKFMQQGIRTGWDLLNTDPLWARKNFSVVQERIIRELRGENCLEMEYLPAPKQSIQVSRSFGEKLTTLEDLEKPVSSFLVRAAEKLRAQNSLASAIFLSVSGKWTEPPLFIHTDKNSDKTDAPPSSIFGWKTSSYQDNTAPTGTYYSNSVTLPLGFPCNNTSYMLPLTLKGLRQIFHPQIAFKKASVTLLGITSRGENQQIQLFDNAPTQDTQRSIRLMETLDALHAQLGKECIVFGTEELPHPKNAPQNTWKSLSERRSPNYTSDWNDLPEVH
ncbi:MAG: Y-family DNA polymerase [Planctomycetia bacterium]|nr:Y-family DNA polymerase [Planctomycetia bacterium]